MFTENDEFRVAIDVMGGDHSPEVPVKGAILAARNIGAKVFVVGDPDQVAPELEKHETSDLDLTLISSEGFLPVNDLDILINSELKQIICSVSIFQLFI